MGRYDKILNDEPADAEDRQAPPEPPAGSRYSMEKLFPPPAASSSEPSAAAPSTWRDYASKAGDIAQALVSPFHAAKLVARNLQTADDAVRAFANAATFGMADRLAGAMPGTSTDEQVKLSEEARKRSPYASIAGDVGGAVALPGIGGRQMAARYGGGLLARGLGYGAEGAALGAAQGAGNTYTGNPIDYLTNAGKSGGMGAVLGFGIGGAFGPRGGARSTAAIPTNPELFAEKTANYRDLNLMPQIYEPSALAARADQVEATLGSPAYRFRPDAMPTARAAIDEMRNPPTTAHLGTGVPLAPGDIDAIWKGINANVTPARSDLASSGVVKRALNDFVLNPPPGAVLPGMETEAARAAATADRARGNYSGLMRGTAFEAMAENARNAAGSANSGLNFENVARQHAKSFIRQDKTGQSAASKAGYNPEEVAALTEYGRGRLGPNIQRYVGNYLGGGGGLAVPLVGSAASQYFRDNPTEGALVGGVAQAAGFATRLAGNRRANREFQALSDMVRQRTPLYQDRAATAPMALPGGPGAAQARNALTLELVRQQQEQE